MKVTELSGVNLTSITENDLFYFIDFDESDNKYYSKRLDIKTFNEYLQTKFVSKTLLYNCLSILNDDISKVQLKNLYEVLKNIKQYTLT